MHPATDPDLPLRRQSRPPEGVVCGYLSAPGELERGELPRQMTRDCQRCFGIGRGTQPELLDLMFKYDGGVERV